MRDERGVAWRLWERVGQELRAQQMTQKTLVDRSGIPASTINNLRTSTRVPQERIVYALADALGIDRDEAAQLAGLPSERGRPAPLSVREAIRMSDLYSDRQKKALLTVVDALDAANAAGQAQPGETRSAG